MQPLVSRVKDVAWDRCAARLTIETLAVGLSAALVGGAIAANQSWLDRHFLPSFLIPRHWYVLIESIARVVVGATGVLLAVNRSRLARLMTQMPGTVLGVFVAAVLAIAASELTLRSIRLPSTEWLVAEEEPRRQADPRLGWVLAPARTGRSRSGGRTIEYAIDPVGCRVRRIDDPVDPRRPTVVFAGESVMFGEGLTWDESI